LLFLTALQSNNVDETIIKEYNHEMKLLEDDMAALLELQKTTAQLTEEAREPLQQIELSIQHTEQNIDETLVQLAEASQLAVKARMKKFALVGGGVGAVLGGAVCGTVGGVFTTPAGGVARK
jgi:t-SNARE complex subunit (syntaxin)